MISHPLLPYNKGKRCKRVKVEEDDDSSQEEVSSLSRAEKQIDHEPSNVPLPEEADDEQDTSTSRKRSASVDLTDEPVLKKSHVEVFFSIPFSDCWIP